MQKEIKIDNNLIILRVDKEKSDLSNVMIVCQITSDPESKEFDSVVTLKCSIYNDNIELDVVKFKTSLQEVVLFMSENFSKFNEPITELISNYNFTSGKLPIDTESFSVTFDLSYPGDTENYDLGVVREYVLSYLKLKYPFISKWKATRLNFNKIEIKLLESAIHVDVEVKKVY